MREGIRRATAGGVALAAVVLAAPTAFAHIERAPIFVDPAPDTSIKPAAGGAFVEMRRPLDPRMAARRFRRSAQRVWTDGVTKRERRVLERRFVRLPERGQRRALRVLRRLVRAHGGPSPRRLGLRDPKVQAEELLVVCRPDSIRRLRASLRQRDDLSRARKRRVLRANRRWRELCRFDAIQPAVTAADNQDTILVMPGFYTEPESREQPHNDPRCAEYVEEETGAATYEYHYRCPNDVGLITMMGEDLEGRCIRCNVQILGTGTRPEDVVVEGAEEAADPGVSGDLFPEGTPYSEAVKEVGLKLERADGTYVRGLTFRNFSEHGLYATETDGLTTSHVKFFWGKEYGFLSFVTDHNLIEHVEAAGSADGGIYPGAAPPSRPRINTILRDSYAHHNVLGFSGTMGSNIRIVNNIFKNNSTGISLDSFYQAGHPGFPQHNTTIEHNLIHSNNFDTYSEDAWIKSSVQGPIGVGILFAGGNDNHVRNNWIYDNWRWGTALITVPDALSNNFDEPPDSDDYKLSTSHRNRQEGNPMGYTPEGEHLPNGLDFWWDEMGQGNCWENNGEVRSDPAFLPDCDDFPNVGAPRPHKEAYLAACGFALDRSPGNPTCDWFTVPPEPQR